MIRLATIATLIFLLGGFTCRAPEPQHIPIAKRVEFRGQEFDCYVIDLHHFDVRMFWKDRNGLPYGSLGNLKAQLQRYGKELLFATNGGMYLKDQSPQGLYIENGKELSKLRTNSGYGNFYMFPNGVFSRGQESFEIVVRDSFERNAQLYATQSGPMLLIDGKIHSAFREGSGNKYVRSGVGLLDEHTAVFAISRATCNFYDFASLFKDHFKCADALYLDGAISKMYAPLLDRHDGGGNFGVIIGVLPNN